jgi:hypothetical protein
MKHDFHLVDESAPNSNLFNNENLLLKSKKEQPPENLSKKVDTNNLGIFNSLSNFWKRLVSNPLSFPQTPNSSISSMLEDEKEILAANMVKTVLSRILELPMDSKKLSNATENSNKIFHEDYPFDFILEYQGKRLGMMLLDICYNSNNEKKLIYRFNPNLKSFQGLS